MLIPKFVTDPLGIIQKALLWNAGVFGDLTQCGGPKYIIFVLLSFSLRRF